MGNNPAQQAAAAVECCCSSAGDLPPGPLDMVTSHHGLSQGPLFKEMHFRAAGTGFAGEEEEIDVEVSVCSPQQHLPEQLPLRRKLLQAVRHDDAPAVLQFVADGADVSDVGEALRLASHRGCAAVVRELVAVGLSVNDPCPHTGFTPLQLAAVSGHVVVCELLLDAMADVHRPIAGATPLSLARKMGNNEVEEIIERHMASMATDQTDVDADGANFRRAHVLPRVSPLLSQAVLQALPPPGRRAAAQGQGEGQGRGTLEEAAARGSSCSSGPKAINEGGAVYAAHTARPPPAPAPDEADHSAGPPPPSVDDSAPPSAELEGVDPPSTLGAEGVDPPITSGTDPVKPL